MKHPDNIDWRIGCSGFSYKEWKGIFYPDKLPQKEWFRFYCGHFNCIEINSSFYKKPSPKSLQKWYDESPDDFLFSIKAPRLITHYKQLIDCKELMHEFYDLVSDGLKEKLGPVLMQFPPRFDYMEERMQMLLNTTNKNIHTVVEFRHASWWQQDVYDRLAANNIVFCGQSYPGAIPEDAVVNRPTAYYRFHGKPILYKSSYAKTKLAKVKNKLKKTHPHQAFVFFNNTWGESALKDSKVFKLL